MALRRNYCHLSDEYSAQAVSFFSFILQNEEVNFCYLTHDVSTT